MDTLDILLVLLKVPVEVYLATDNKPTIKAFEERYHDIQFIYQNCHRSEGWFGEEHTKRKNDSHQLFEEVVIDAYVLSSCDYLIHGNSNVSNFVLCLNPSLSGTNIYGY